MRPFLNVNRKPAFTMKPEYENYPIEENKEIYLSSCWFVKNILKIIKPSNK